MLMTTFRNLDATFKLSKHLCFVSKHVDSTRSILKAMLKSPKARRFLTMHSWYTNPASRSSAPSLIKPYVVQYGDILDDMNNVEKMLRTEDWTRPISYTIICSPDVVDEQPLAGGVMVCEDSTHIKGHYKDVPAANIGLFLYQIIRDKKFSKQTVAIGSYL